MKRRVLIVAAAALLCAGGIFLLWSTFLVPQTTYQGKTVNAWMRQLFAYGEPGKEAKAAFEAMGKRAVPDLIRLLSRTDGPFAPSLRSIAQRLPPRGRRVMLRFVPPYPAYESRLGAARALAIIGPEATDALKFLVGRIRDPNVGVACEAARALISVQPDCGTELVAALKDANPNARRAAALACAQLGANAGPVLPELIRRLEDKEPQIRGAAEGSLRIVGAPAVPDLLRFAAAREGKLQELAKSMVVGSYGAGSVPQLGKDFLDLANDSVELRRERAQAVLELRSYNEKPALVQLIAAAAVDSCPEVRLAAVQALQGNCTPVAVNALSARLTDTSPEVRAAAARAMGELGSAGRVGLPRLRLLTQDDQSTVRAAADEALTRIASAVEPKEH